MRISIRLQTQLLASFALLVVESAEEIVRFYPCDEKAGVVQMSRAAYLGTKVLEHCAVETMTGYTLSAHELQAHISKLCVIIRLCFHKHKDVKLKQGLEAYKTTIYACGVNLANILIVKLNPELTRNRVVNASRYFDNLKACFLKNEIFTDDVKVALAGLKWLLKTIF